jgi:peptidoglycan/xylan/chitin deacetylase (PgdA/CDA1 family)
MPESRTELVLTYHQTAAQASGYLYEVTAERLRQHCSFVNAQSLHDRVRFTFDDGHISNFEIAVPILEEFGVSATFFVTTDWIGREQYMRTDHLSQLVRRGHRVQSHSASHPFLTTINESRLCEELAGSKQRLESITGVQVDEISAPGGRWSLQVVRAAAEQGYSRFYTSDRWSSKRSVHGTEILPRVMVTAATTDGTLLRWLNPSVSDRAKGMLTERAKAVCRSVIGENRYQQLWSLLARAPKEVS